MIELAEKVCKPCAAGTEPLGGEALAEMLRQLPLWQAVNGRLVRTFSFRNFIEALAFVNTIGHLAEKEGHHPSIQLSWGKVIVELYTHKINGLSDNDFILAAKIDQLYGDDVE